MPPPDICFLATAKSGLGHIRRITTIAARVAALAPDRKLHLVTNARPDGISSAELAVFSTMQIIERALMAQALPGSAQRVLVLDTMTVPGIETTGAPLALILREAPDTELHRFRLAQGRAWDLVMIANPAGHWMPQKADLPAEKVVPLGWIYRPTGKRVQQAGGVPVVLVATGGGGTAETSAMLYALIDALLARVRSAAPPFQVVQAIGPRARAFGQLAHADRTLDPGPLLNAQFRDADIVISTAGYNSVLELATTDTPTLLVPIPRSIDDQAARASVWAKALGCWLDAAAPDKAEAWLVQAIATCPRRAPVDLGPSGEDAAARAILQLA
ncbi:MAG: hypothetical protein MUD11_10170 [Rhodobacteraceae bacterium]|nr:hypothetical protein [Paracoccaceae bacterium]